MIDLLTRNAGVLLPAIWLTLKLNLFALGIGLPLAIVLFSTRTSDNGILRVSSLFVTEAIKGFPALVVMFWLYLCLPLAADIRISAVTASVIALALNYGANAAEVFRSAWAAVKPDLQVSMQLLGVPKISAVSLFQAPLLIRATVPGLLAQLAATIKLSAVAAFIGVPEVFHATQGLIQESQRSVELYTALALFYLLLVVTITALEYYCRSCIGRGTHST